MSITSSNKQRRNILQMAAGIVTAGQLGLPARAAATDKTKPNATGKPGDFTFLTGNWKIKNRQLKDKKWENFDSEASVFEILNGIASIEELRIPARKFSGMGLRLLDLEQKLWADYWVNAKGGVLTPPPSWGSFSDGVGIWDSHDNEGDKPVIYRGVWDKITPTTCRWYQASSRNGGKTWDESWVMDWARA